MAKRETEAETHPWDHWARLRGHVAVLAVRPTLRGPREVTHRGPDVRVVRAYHQWPLGKMMTESDYDAAVDSAYSAAIR